MDLYGKASQETAAIFMKRYSTSFGLASRLFPAGIRQHIYNIYGLVRIADEVVDTYAGPDQLQRLNQLEQEVSLALTTGYSSNPVVQAFQITSQAHGISPELISPFFDSMRLDCLPQKYDEKLYRQYIYGSAEVIGLMCLKVFVADKEYRQLQSGARHLGAAFQKINFLRDIAEDYRDRQRYYLPAGNFESFDDAIKSQVVADIRHDLQQSFKAIQQLPSDIRPAILTAYDYFGLLLKKLDSMPASNLKQRRVRVADSVKLWLLARRLAAGQLHPKGRTSHA